MTIKRYSTRILPEFYQILITYNNEVTALSYRFVRLFAEASELPSKTFDILFRSFRVLI
jgi:isopenicillin N synthase-like dioxygenase